MYCKYKETREELVKVYYIEAISHVKLLNGQIKKSCTDARLTDQYYCFSYKNKKNSKDAGTFLCGKPTAEHFLQLTGKKPLPLFNPLVGENNNLGEHNGINTQQDRLPMNNQTKEFLEAVNLLIMAWNVSLYGKLLNDVQNRRKYSHRPPYDSEIKRLNKIIGDDNQGRTLTQMIDELRANNNIRQFSFDALRERLAEMLENSEIESINL